MVESLKLKYSPAVRIILQELLNTILNSINTFLKKACLNIEKNPGLIFF
jgi:hypothetical protein